MSYKKPATDKEIQQLVAYKMTQLAKECRDTCAALHPHLKAVDAKYIPEERGTEIKVTLNFTADEGSFVPEKVVSESRNFISHLYMGDDEDIQAAKRSVHNKDPLVDNLNILYNINIYQERLRSFKHGLDSAQLRFPKGVGITLSSSSARWRSYFLSKFFNTGEVHDGWTIAYRSLTNYLWKRIEDQVFTIDIPDTRAYVEVRFDDDLASDIIPWYEPSRVLDLANQLDEKSKANFDYAKAFARSVETAYRIVLEYEQKFKDHEMEIHPVRSRDKVVQMIAPAPDSNLRGTRILELVVILSNKAKYNPRGYKNWIDLYHTEDQIRRQVEELYQAACKANSRAKRKIEKQREATQQFRSIDTSKIDYWRY